MSTCDRQTAAAGTRLVIRPVSASDAAGQGTQANEAEANPILDAEKAEAVNSIEGRTRPQRQSKTNAKDRIKGISLNILHEE